MGRPLRKPAPPMTPDEMVRRLMEPAAKAMNRRAELVLEAAGKAAANLALEQAAQIAERFFVEERADAPPLIRERLRRQNSVAAEIAECIRAEKHPA